MGVLQLPDFPFLNFNSSIVNYVPMWLLFAEKFMS